MKLDYKQFEAESQTSTNNWLISFADLLSLLVGFFILVYSFSEPQQNKYAQIQDALKTENQNLNSTKDYSNKNNLPEYSPTKNGVSYLVGLIKNILNNNNIVSAKVYANGQSTVIEFDVNFINSAEGNVFFNEISQLINSLNNQLEISVNSSDIENKKIYTKQITDIFYKKGYSKEIFEFYSDEFSNISNDNENTALVLIRPYENFK